MSVTKVTNRVIADNTITNAQIATNAEIAGTKINTNFGNKNLVTTGVLSADGSGIYNVSKRDSDQFLRFRNTENETGSTSYYRSSSFLSKDGRLYFAGYGEGYLYGSGDNNTYMDNGFRSCSYPSTFNDINGERVSQHYMCSNSMYFLTNFGNVFSIGYNGYGQLGTGNTTNQFNWFKTSLSNITWLSPSNGLHAATHCLALNNLGQLFGAGWGGNYQFGNNSTGQLNVFTRINTGSIQDKVLTKVYAIGDDYTTYSYSFAIDSDKNVHVCGTNGGGQLGTGNQTQVTTWTRLPVAIKADKIKSGCWNSGGAAFILFEGKLYASGDNYYGQQGNGNTNRQTTFTLCSILHPVLDLQGLSVVDFYVMDYHGGSLAALISDGSIRTWGWNNYGQVGDGTRTNRVITAFSPGMFGSSNKAIKIEGTTGMNGGTWYVLDEKGVLWSSGRNYHGARGHDGTAGEGAGSFNDTFQKMLIPYPDCKFVDFVTWGQDTGNGITALDSRGDLYACGYNGQFSCGIQHHGGHLYNAHVLKRCTIN
jgi:alpha-tubulin suppressor-like RCC1 family protein